MESPVPCAASRCSGLCTRKTSRTTARRVRPAASFLLIGLSRSFCEEIGRRRSRSSKRERLLTAGGDTGRGRKGAQVTGFFLAEILLGGRVLVEQDPTWSLMAGNGVSVHVNRGRIDEQRLAIEPQY